MVKGTLFLKSCSMYIGSTMASHLDVWAAFAVASIAWCIAVALSAMLVVDHAAVGVNTAVCEASSHTAQGEITSNQLRYHCNKTWIIRADKNLMVSRPMRVCLVHDPQSRLRRLISILAIFIVKYVHLDYIPSEIQLAYMHYCLVHLCTYRSWQKLPAADSSPRL